MKILYGSLSILLFSSLLTLNACAKQELFATEAMYDSKLIAEDTTTAPSPPVTEAPVTESSQHNRLIIYNASLSLVVENITTTFDKIITVTEANNGYMQSMDVQSITIRVPASQLNKILQEIETFGQVTAKEIRGSDVTEEMLDLNIRLDNAEELRKRLIKLLDRADKVEDAIKLEKELSRVTETIETLKGKIRYLNNQVAFSTVTVRLNSSLPQQIVEETIPFPWVCELGNEISAGGSKGYYQRPKGGGIKFDLSESFLRYYESRSLTRASSADGVLIKVQRLDNIKDASLQFWTDLTKRALQMKQAVYISGTRNVKIGKKKNDAIIIEGTKTIGRQKFAYMLCMTMTKRYVFTYEAWGQEEKLQHLRDEIEDSMKSMNVSGSFF